MGKGDRFKHEHEADLQHAEATGTDNLVYWSVIGVLGKVPTYTVMTSLGPNFQFIERMLNNNFVVVRGPWSKDPPELSENQSWRVATATPPPARTTSKTLIVHVLPPRDNRHKLLQNDDSVDVDLKAAKIILDDMKFPYALASRVFCCFAGKPQKKGGDRGDRAKTQKQTLQFYVEMISEEAALTCLGRWDAFYSKPVNAYIHVHQLSRTNFRSGSNPRYNSTSKPTLQSWKIQQQQFTREDQERALREVAATRRVIALSYVSGTPLAIMSTIGGAEGGAAAAIALKPSYTEDDSTDGHSSAQPRSRDASPLNAAQQDPHKLLLKAVMAAERSTLVGEEIAAERKIPLPEERQLPLQAHMQQRQQQQQRHVSWSATAAAAPPPTAVAASGGASAFAAAPPAATQGGLATRRTPLQAARMPAIIKKLQQVRQHVAVLNIEIQRRAAAAR